MLKKFLFLKTNFTRLPWLLALEIALINNSEIYVFDNKAATRLLFFKIEEKYWSVLKTFLIYLSMMPETVKGIRGKDIISSDIQLNQEVIDKLRDFDGSA